MDEEALANLLATAAPKDARALRSLIGLATDEAATLVPLVRRLAEEASSGTFLMPRDERVLDIGLHVLAAAGRTAALPALLALLRAAPVIVERVLGLECVAVGARLAISLSDGDGDGDGDAAPLLALAADPTAPGDGRWSVLLALAWLARAGRIDAAPVVALLRRLDEERLAPDDDLTWLGWRDVIVYLGLEDLAPRLEAMAADGRLGPEHPEDRAAFLERLALGVERPGDLGLLEEDGVHPVPDLSSVLDWLVVRPGRRKAPARGRFAAVALDRDELGWLAGFLVSPQALEGTFDLETLDGFFAALVAGPELVLPSEYMPVLWGGDGPEFASMAQAEHVTELLMRHWNTIAARLEAGVAHEPELFPATLAVSGRRWAEGFLVGMDLRRDAWQPLFEDEEPAAAVAAIMALIQDEHGEAALDGEERADVIEALGRLVLLIGLYWRARRDQPRRAPLRVPRIGRNEACPCGSGKKYKRCCGAN